MAFVSRSCVRLIAVGLWLATPALAKTVAKTPATKSERAGPRAVGEARASQAKGSAQPAPAPIPADIEALGPLSVGHPHAGFLVNGVKLPSSEDWVITMPSHGYGTQETNDALASCIGKVRREIPNSPKVMLGSLSAERGGHLPPHKSHRTGRDADVYFFRKPGAQWSKAATASDIDLGRTWALLRCFVTETDVEMILIDRKVQRWLENHALSVGEDRKWIETLFHDDGRNKTAVVRHVPGHVAHMHVRFVSPEARRRAVQHYDRLVAARVVVPEQRGVVHVVQKGDTLSALGRRYGVTVARIRELNALGSSLIRVGQKLTVEQPVDIRGARDRVVVPARRLPPGQVAPPAPIERVVVTPAPVEPSEPKEPAAASKPPGPPPRQSSEPAGRASS